MISAVLGGVGLFLIGMVLLTDGLKALAGDSLRRVLTRFTGGPVSGLISGTAVTALVQSSSATTLATIGFVSAGLLTFPQALGVILGANLGTTSTGWLVSLLGLKFSVSAVAMPLVGVGALMRLVTRGRGASIGLALAGFGLIFVGIDTLQIGMKGLAEKVTPAAFPDDTIAGRLLLVGIGAVMTVVVQSSSAAVAMTLTALHAGTISLEQAAALVIGQNVGTTVTAGIASVGASVAAKRTALAHVLFNVVTAVAAFALLPAFIRLANAAAARLGGDAGATSLAAFHTGFNLLGIALFLPLTARFAALIERLVAERGPALTRHLDRSAANIPAIAVEVARRTVVESAIVVVRAVRGLLRGEERPERAAEDLEAVRRALDETRAYVARIRVGLDQPAVHARLLSTLHGIDHLDRAVEACEEAAPRETVAVDEGLRKIASALSEELDFTVGWLEGRAPDAPVERAGKLSRSVADMRRAHRPEVLSRTAAGDIDPAAAARELEAMRWVDRLAYHTWRLVHHLSEQATGAAAAAAPAPEDGPAPGPAAPADRGTEDIGAGAPG